MTQAVGIIFQLLPGRRDFVVPHPQNDIFIINNFIQSCNKTLNHP